MRRPLAIIVLGLALAVPGCEETDEVLIDDIGTVRVYFVNTGVGSQSMEQPDANLQVSQSLLAEALMVLDGRPIDLLIKQGDPLVTCEVNQTSAFLIPLVDGRCASGMVIDADVGEREFTLEVSFGLQVRRARPEYTTPGGDTDDDGVLDEDDNCPFAPNPGQDDTGNTGFGDACKTFDPNSGDILLDTDQDFIADIVDNCLWAYNPSQEDSGLDGDGIPDGIGDACEEQLAEVIPSSGGTIRVPLGPELLNQVRNTVSNLTVDIRSETLTCDWDIGLCSIAPETLVLCVHADVFSALSGCPD